MRRRFLLLCVASSLALPACELTEVTTTEAQDVVIAEVVLRAGDTVQTAYLHRTLTEHVTTSRVQASVVVRNANGSVELRFSATEDSVCLDQGSGDGSGTCYVARTSATAIAPGNRYTLRIDLPDGRSMSGSTDVPGAFRIIKPVGRTAAGVTNCRLEPNTVFDITWTMSVGASVYLTESKLHNIRQALRAAGTDVEGDDPVDLFGVSISAEDTTLAFPSELGLFDRFDTELFPVLLAMRDGLPAGVDATLVIAAADRNYVNWIRGGNFNPSGVVRVASIQGDGYGVFGSLVTHRLRIRTQNVNEPSCTGP